MADTLRVVMIGSPRIAYAFEQEIGNEGLRATSDAPAHERDAPINTMRHTFEISGDPALRLPGTRAAIQRLEERYPRVEFTFEIETGDDDGDSSGGGGDTA